MLACAIHEFLLLVLCKSNLLFINSAHKWLCSFQLCFFFSFLLRISTTVLFLSLPFSCVSLLFSTHSFRLNIETKIKMNNTKLPLTKTNWYADHGSLILIVNQTSTINMKKVENKIENITEIRNRHAQAMAHSYTRTRTNNIKMCARKHSNTRTHTNIFHIDTIIAEKTINFQTAGT